MRIFKGFIVFVMVFAFMAPVMAKNPHVLLQTTMGDIELELFEKKAPMGVENFLQYVKDGFYDGTIFHRVIPNFMVQGGGMLPNMQKKETRAPIINEATNGLKNKRGTLAYARTNVVNSATAQFFINHRDNAFLDHKNTSQEGFGYAVFGKVVHGMNVVDKIAKVKTQKLPSGYADVPKTPIVITKAMIVE